LKKEVLYLNDFQGTSVMNYSDIDVKYTRVHEPKHLHPERKYSDKSTIIFFEFSRSGQENPYYPINNQRNNDLLKKYKELSNQHSDVIIGGRLGDYAYYDMDKTILAALECYEKKILKNPTC
jgi:UDP-galactopyranose mutase